MPLEGEMGIFELGEEEYQNGRKESTTENECKKKIEKKRIEVKGFGDCDLEVSQG